MSLKAVYEDPARTSRDPRVLASRAGGSVKSAEAFLRDQESSHFAKQWRKPSASSGAYTPTGAPAGHWQADVTFLEDYKGVNDRRKAILTVLNTTTRFAVARPLLAATADKTAEAMREVLAELSAAKRNIQVLRVDGGGEFKGAFRELVHAAGIQAEVSEANTHYRLARTDRFHRTLRERIGEHFERANTHRWVDALPAIVDNLNSAPHRTLTEVLGRSTAPNQVTAAQEKLIRQAEAVESSEVGAFVDRQGFVLGETKVRLLVSRTREGVRDQHAKSQRRVWTSDVYTVTERAGPNSFIVDVPAGEVRVWPYYALQVVKKALRSAPVAPGSKVNVRVERAKRLEARNISEDEQAANLAAVAHAPAPAGPLRRSGRIAAAAAAPAPAVVAPVPAAAVRRSSRLAASG